MNRPIPHVYCPTKVLMDKAIRALYDAGYVGRDHTLDQLMARVPDDAACAEYAYLAYAGEDGGARPAYLWPCGRYNLWAAGTRCNSPAHMISYLRRLS